jgi:hypothetical protein
MAKIKIKKSKKEKLADELVKAVEGEKPVTKAKAKKEKKPNRKGEKHPVLGMGSNTMGPMCYELFAQGLYTREECVAELKEQIEAKAITHQDRPVNAMKAVGFWLLPKQQRERHYRVRILDSGIIQAIPFDSDSDATDRDFEKVFGSPVHKPKRRVEEKRARKAA